MRSTFRPPWWLANRHLQTLWPTFFRRGPRPTLHRERLELPDGDFVDLDWTHARGDRPDAPVVIVLHGLEGSSNSSYAWGAMNEVLGRGWNGLVFHFRGCSGEPNRLDRRYHSGETEDIGAVVAHVRALHPGQAVCAIGFSLGGNVLLKWLGETGGDNPLHSAVAVSVPFDLDRCAHRLERGFSRLYQWWLMRSMRSSVLDKHGEDISPPVDLGTVRSSSTFRQFDDVVTAPLHGFDGVDDYYNRSSCGRYISGIRRPTLILHALDDPFMYPEVCPPVDDLPTNVELEATGAGGHVGFVYGTPRRPRYWHEERAFAFLATRLETGA